MESVWVPYGNRMAPAAGWFGAVRAAALTRPVKEG